MSVTFDSVGVRKFDGAARLQREAYRAWLAGLLCNVIAGVYTLYSLQMAAKKSKDSQDAEKAVELKKLEKYVSFLRLSMRCVLTLSSGKGARHNCSSSLIYVTAPCQALVLEPLTLTMVSSVLQEQ